MFEFCQDLLVHPRRTPPNCLYLISCTWEWSILELGRGDPWKSTRSPRALFSPETYPTGFFEADSWTHQSLPSWSPGLWSCILLCSLLSWSWTPSLHGHSNQDYPWIWHPQTGSSLTIKIRSSRASTLIRFSITCQEALFNAFQKPHGYILLCCPSSRYCDCQSPSWGAGPMNVKLTLAIWSWPYLLVLPDQAVCSRHSKIIPVGQLANPDP